jgi:hypothetical protein
MLGSSAKAVRADLPQFAQRSRQTVYLLADFGSMVRENETERSDRPIKNRQSDAVMRIVLAIVNASRGLQSKANMRPEYCRPPV